VFFHKKKNKAQAQTKLKPRDHGHEKVAFPVPVFDIS
jgi:hypothetical protein